MHGCLTAIEIRSDRVCLAYTDVAGTTVLGRFSDGREFWSVPLADDGHPFEYIITEFYVVCAHIDGFTRVPHCPILELANVVLGPGELPGPSEPAFEQFIERLFEERRIERAKRFRDLLPRISDSDFEHFVQFVMVRKSHCRGKGLS
jgi:hypothetical protein